MDMKKQCDASPERAEYFNVNLINANLVFFNAMFYFSIYFALSGLSSFLVSLFPGRCPGLEYIAPLGR